MIIYHNCCIKLVLLVNSISWCQIFIEKFNFEYFKNGPGFLSGGKDIRNLHWLKEYSFFVILYSYWISDSQSCILPPNDGGNSKIVINNLKRSITSFITCFNTNTKPAFRPHNYCEFIVILTEAAIVFLNRCK